MLSLGVWFGRDQWFWTSTAFEGLNILLTWHTLTSAETKNAYFCFTRKGKVRLGSNFDVFAGEFSI